MSKHTPGPWLVEYDNADDRSGGQWFDVGPARIHFSYGADAETRLQAKSDAALISAAPELLDALQRLLAAYSMSHSPADRLKSWDQAKAAIAKATVTT